MALVTRARARACATGPAQGPLEHAPQGPRYQVWTRTARAPTGPARACATGTAPACPCRRMGRAPQAPLGPAQGPSGARVMTCPQGRARYGTGPVPMAGPASSRAPQGAPSRPESGRQGCLRAGVKVAWRGTSRALDAMRQGHLRQGPVADPPDPHNRDAGALDISGHVAYRGIAVGMDTPAGRKVAMDTTVDWREARRTYRVVRFYFNRPGYRRTIIERCTLAEAQTHCSDPDTSSSTATTPAARARTRKLGPWFDGYEER